MYRLSRWNVFLARIKVSLQLTPERCAAIYECLRAFPPFGTWKLPPSDEVEFRTTRRLDCEAEHQAFTDGAQRIMVSIAKIGQWHRACVAVAHEMVHLSQDLAGTANKYQHNADFVARWRLVSRQFGFDPKEY